jgi:hypothetical protein
MIVRVMRIPLELIIGGASVPDLGVLTATVAVL